MTTGPLGARAAVRPRAAVATPAVAARPTTLTPVRLLGALVTLGVAAAMIAVPGKAQAVAQAPVTQATVGQATVDRTCSSTPFRTSEAKKHWFRLPSIVRTQKGTLLAFAERRDSVINGIGDFDVVTARSTDDGCTWSAYRVIGNDAGNRVSNAVPVVDRTNGNVLLFSTVLPVSGGGGDGRGIYVQTSRDDGKTWSGLLKHRINPRGFNGGLTGPGHGIQLSVTHPGRIVVPMGYRTKSGSFGAYCLYSDDHGASWSIGYRTEAADKKIEYVEGTAAELPDGRLFISYRNGSTTSKPGVNTRYYAYSSDGGATLSQGFRPQDVTMLSIEASTLQLSGSGALLFSAPASVARRNDLAIYRSTDGGATFPRRYQIDLEDTPGAYSDLVQLDDATIGVVYETGSSLPKERIGFKSIRVAELSNPTLVTSKISYERSDHPTLTSSNAKVKVKVSVKGVKGPGGKVTLSYTRAGSGGRKSVELAKYHEGARVITLPRLSRGKYSLTLTYSGTARIKKVTRSAGTLQVITK